MSHNRDSPFNSGQASRVRIFAPELKKIYEELDEWWFHYEAKEVCDGWNRSKLRRLNQSSIIESKDAETQDQKKWRIPDSVIDYIEEKGYA